jgi:hypothetical protein
MTTRSIAHLVLTAAIAVVAQDGLASEASPQSRNEQVNANVKVLAAAQMRVLSRAAAFCSNSQLPPGRPLDQRLASYIEAFSIGTAAGMNEIASTDNNSDILSPIPAHSKTDIEMMDKQGEIFLKAAQSSPERGCKKLSELLDAGSIESFKNSTLQNYQEYKLKRLKYCSKEPKPKNCE